MSKNILIGILALIVIVLLYLIWRGNQPRPTQKEDELRDSLRIAESEIIDYIYREDSIRKVQTKQQHIADSTNKADKAAIAWYKNKSQQVRVRTVFVPNTSEDSLVKYQDTTIVKLEQHSGNLAQQIKQDSAQYNLRLAAKDTALLYCEKAKAYLYGIVDEKDKQLKNKDKRTLKERILAGLAIVLAWLAGKG